MEDVAWWFQILKYMFDRNLGDRKEKTMADYIVQMVGSVAIPSHTNMLSVCASNMEYSIFCSGRFQTISLHIEEKHCWKSSQFSNTFFLKKILMSDMWVCFTVLGVSLSKQKVLREPVITQWFCCYYLLLHSKLLWSRDVN